LTKAQARAQLGLPRSDKIILFFGNIRPYKRLDLMLDAFIAVRSRLPEARLIVVGKPWSGSREVEQAISRAWHIPGVDLRLEYVPERLVEAYFMASDVVAYTHMGFEAQSGAAATAVHYGKAMVVSRAGGLPDFVRDDRAVVSPGDPLAFASALESILRGAELRRKLERDARRVATDHSWTRVAEMTAALYVQIASGGLAPMQEASRMFDRDSNAA
jgi:glycosyltransferase involved in cell wall biosynthesis